jgi:hypothetical protein
MTMIKLVTLEGQVPMQIVIAVEVGEELPESDKTDLLCARLERMIGKHLGDLFTKVGVTKVDVIND